MSAPEPASPAIERIVLPWMHVAAASCLGLITLWYPATTRMWAWPWSLALAATLALPAVALIIRTLLSRSPFALPARAWCTLALGFTGVVLLSAIASPQRASSLRWSAPVLGGIAVFFLVFDWLQREPERTTTRKERLRDVLVIMLLLVAVPSVGFWLVQLGEFGPAVQLLRRNAFPLGHSNYTACLALLLLPTAVAVAWRQHGVRRALAASAAALALAMLFTSGSRGGLLALGVLLAVGIWRAALSHRIKWTVCTAGGIAALGLVLAHPRTRAMLHPAPDDPSLLAASDVQRSAMLHAAWQMGMKRPLLGWGPGTTPLVYPRFRGTLEGGAENVLQLHSLPAQIWAELGAAGLVCLLALVAALARGVARDSLAATTLIGYGVFSLTDWQLDIPIFAALVAVFTACCAKPPAHLPISTTSRARLAVGLTSLVGLAMVVLLGHRDPTAELNTRALALGREPANADRASALLRESLALNPDQEIAHFNLGWLLVVRDPAAAERHFRAAARLVPDKGGVYLGIGLARLNQGRPAEAARAFALEALDDPAFLASPWWREPAIAATRDAAEQAFRGFVSRARTLAPGASAKLAQLEAVASELGRSAAGPERIYRRERTGYPVLMRAPNLAPPVDLFEVRELQTPPSWLASLPPKGWLPSPVLLTLLDASVSPKS